MSHLLEIWGLSVSRWFPSLVCAQQNITENNHLCRTLNLSYLQGFKKCHLKYIRWVSIYLEGKVRRDSQRVCETVSAFFWCLLQRLSEEGV